MSRTDLASAIDKAHNMSDRTGREYYVVYDIGEYDMEYFVSDDNGLETFHAGISDNNILYSTIEGHQV